MHVQLFKQTERTDRPKTGEFESPYLLFPFQIKFPGKEKVLLVHGNKREEMKEENSQGKKKIIRKIYSSTLVHGSESIKSLRVYNMHFNCKSIKHTFLCTLKPCRNPKVWDHDRRKYQRWLSLWCWCPSDNYHYSQALGIKDNWQAWNHEGKKTLEIGIGAELKIAFFGSWFTKAENKSMTVENK